jgi:uncharacterized protein YndB with AHSA1/START domain
VDVNRTAPVIAEAETEIAAPPERVFARLVDVERWPEWNHEVKTVKLEGGLQVGSVFRWKAGPGTITSTFQAVEPPSHVAWTGKTLSLKAVHIWTLEPTETGTRVRTAESFEGAAARLLRRVFQSMLQTELEKGLQALKDDLERDGAPLGGVLLPRG